MTRHASMTRGWCCTLMVAVLCIVVPGSAAGGCPASVVVRGRPHLGCSVTKFSVDCFIELVKKLENGGWATSAPRVSAYLRLLGYDGFKWAVVCGTTLTGTVYKTGLNDDEIKTLKNMIGHKYHPDTGTDTGVALTRDGTVALGHVIAGVDCGGFHRDTSLTTIELYGFTSSNLDNLYFSTISGDIGQATLAYYSNTTKYCLFGPKGNWDNEACPKVYKTNSKNTKITDAEALGDIDGVVLGAIIPKIKERKWKLSRILSKYYQKDGINVGGKIYSSANRAVRFGEIVSEAYLTYQSTAFAEAYYKKFSDSYGDADRDYLLSKIPSAVKTFFKRYIEADEHTSTGSHFLPDYKTLMAVYPGEISAVDLRKEVTGNLKLDKIKSLAATEGLRMSYMLNRLNGHHISKTQSDGAVIGTDKNVYIYDMTALKTYLTETYLDSQNAASVTSFAGQRGIMMLDVSRTDGSSGSVGLWDGSKMHQVADYTKSASVRSITLWKTKGCATLAETGDCEFYTCVENAFPCGDDGYAAGYGYRYCKIFSIHYQKFTTAGKVWVNEVRKCLMKAIAPFYKGAHTCDTIKRIAFDTHVNCYLKSGVGFCNMAKETSNWDALWDVYEISESVRPDYIDAWKQVLDTSKYCLKELGKSDFDKLQNTIQGEYVTLKQAFQSSQAEGSDDTNAETDVSSECVAFANAGDCRFYRCFHQRFPCDVFDTSHVIDFELQLCNDLNSQSSYFDFQGGQWTTATNKCLMQKLLPQYRQASVSCIHLHAIMFQDRIDCLVVSGFCGVTDSTHNRWAIDRGTNLASYPALLPDKAGLSMAGREYFYRELSSLRRIMGYANFVCYAKGLKQHESLYVLVLTGSGYRRVEQN